jgi:hypothetical protein
MDFKNSYPDFAAIEAHIRRARVERSVAIAQFLADAVVGTWRGLRKMGASLAQIKAHKPARTVATR